MSEREIRFSRDASFSDLITEKFSQLRENEDLVDFCINVEKKKFNCHKMLVASHSPVLHRMMTSEMKEGRENRVSLNNLSSDAMEKIMNYFYTGNFSCPSSLLLEVVKACEFLQVDHLLNLCKKEVLSILTPKNAIEWLRLASLLDMNVVSTKCLEIICESFSEVAQEEEFLSLTALEVKDCIVEAIRRKVSTDDLSRAVLCWLRADLAERVKHGEDILKQIKLEKCSKEFLKSAIEEFSDVLEADPSIFKLYFFSMAGKNEAAVSEAPDRQTLLLIGGRDNKKAWKLTEKNEFEEVTSIPDEVYSINHSICLYDNIGFVVTGGNDRDTCTMFQLHEQKWKR